MAEGSFPYSSLFDSCPFLFIPLLSLLALLMPPQLQQVMRQAYQSPFRPHLLLSPQQELAKSPSVFHLTKDRLDHPLSPGISLPSFLGPQLASHPLLGRQSLGAA